MNRYKTVLKEAAAQQVIEKSKFTAHVKPVFSKEEADEFISRIKAENRNATHNVPAIVLGENFQIQWASDDGEPQGTAGAPIIQMLVKEGITNVAVVVTRIFGGIKLGTGGLVRAYTSSAKLGLSAATICQVKELMILTVKFNYTYLSKVQNQSQTGSFEIIDTKYEDAVTLDVAVSPFQVDEVRTLFSNMTAGSQVWLGERAELIKIAI